MFLVYACLFASMVLVPASTSAMSISILVSWSVLASASAMSVFVPKMAPLLSTSGVFMLVSDLLISMSMLFMSGMSVLVLGLLLSLFISGMFMPMPKLSAYPFMSYMSMPIPRLSASLFMSGVLVPVYGLSTFPSLFVMSVPISGIFPTLFFIWSFLQIPTLIPGRQRLD